MKPCRNGHTAGRYKSGHCIECERINALKYYHTHPAYREKAKASNQKRRESNRPKWNAYSRQYNINKKTELVLYKGNKCLDCKHKFPIVCYDFDHREPAEKSFAVCSRLGLPIEELKREADKCDLVCSNCHRIRTSGNLKISKKISDGFKLKKTKE